MGITPHFVVIFTFIYSTVSGYTYKFSGNLFPGETFHTAVKINGDGYDNVEVGVNDAYQQLQYLTDDVYQQPQYLVNDAYQQPQYLVNNAYQQPQYFGNGYQQQQYFVNNDYKQPQYFENAALPQPQYFVPETRYLPHNRYAQQYFRGYGDVPLYYDYEDTAGIETAFENGPEGAAEFPATQQYFRGYGDVPLYNDYEDTAGVETAFGNGVEGAAEFPANIARILDNQGQYTFMRSFFIPGEGEVDESVNVIRGVPPFISSSGSVESGPSTTDNSTKLNSLLITGGFSKTNSSAVTDPSTGANKTFYIPVRREVDGQKALANRSFFIPVRRETGAQE